MTLNDLEPRTVLDSGTCTTIYRATARNATLGLAIEILSVRLSVGLSNAWTVTK